MTTDESFRQRMAEWILRHQLFKGVSRLGIAVSGGADSIALARLLVPLCTAAQIKPFILHVHHGIRIESDEEATFVRTFSASLHIPFLFQKLTLEKNHSLSLEMNARKARILFFKSTVQQHHLDAIATGHHALDQVETLLLRLARGAGLDGLTGMRPISFGNGFRIIRPLLPFDPNELRVFLNEIGQEWREDRSNQDISIPRNKIRTEILPLLETVWEKKIVKNLAQSASILSEDDHFLSQLAQEKFNELKDRSNPCRLPAAPLRTLHRALQSRIIRLWLFQCGKKEIPFQAISRLLDALLREATTSISLPNGNQVSLSQTELFIPVPDIPSAAAIELPLPGIIQWGDWIITAEPATGWKPTSQSIGESPSIHYLDKIACDNELLIIRARKPGDRIFPTRMTGSQKVKDLFINAKIPEQQREKIPLLTTGDKVILLPGARVHRDFAVKNTTAASWKITLTKNQQ